MISNLNILLSNSLINHNTDNIDEFSDTYNYYKQSGNSLYRGSIYYGDEIILQPEDRNSAYTSNVYTCLFSELLPSWKNYPKRNHCIVCTTDYNKAKEYDYTNDNCIYQIFPINNAKLGVCPASDLWNSFSYASKILFNNPKIQLPHFNTAFVIFLYYTSVFREKNGSYKMKYSLSNIKNKFRDFDTIGINELFVLSEQFILNNLDYEIDKSALQKDFHALNETVSLCENFFNYMIKNIKIGKTIISILDEIFNPEKNGFKLITTNNISTILNNACEVWFDAECLCITNKRNN